MYLNSQNSLTLIYKPYLVFNIPSMCLFHHLHITTLHSLLTPLLHIDITFTDTTRLGWYGTRHDYVNVKPFIQNPLHELTIDPIYLEIYLTFLTFAGYISHTVFLYKLSFWAAVISKICYKVHYN